MYLSLYDYLVFSVMFIFLLLPRPPSPSLTYKLFPYTTFFRSSVTVALVPVAAPSGGAGRDRTAGDQPACAAPRLCNAPARRRCRSARAATDARPRRYRDDRNLYPCRQQIGRAHV